jgi:hypothetical protein
LLPHLRRLENYISQLPSARHATLCLDIRGSACLAVGDDKALRAWTTRMESLLKCILEKLSLSFHRVYLGHKQFSVPAPL